MIRTPITVKLAAGAALGTAIILMNLTASAQTPPVTPAAAAPPATTQTTDPSKPNYIGPGMAEPPPMPETITWSGRFMPRELAVEAALAALDACKKRGARNAVVVADPAGVEQVAISDTGARRLLVQAARKKAQTAGWVLRPGAETVNNPAYQQIIRDVVGDGVINVSGAQLIMVGNEVIGVIAVGGRGAAEENWCALEGIKKIQSRLK